MIKCYTVLINLGFGGEIFFQKKENAEYFIKTIKDNYVSIELEEVTATPKEYMALNFSDPLADETL